mmetsp:Transcript_3328/g.6772  ORF Transcript_3328/g.6772 Transcript_3328/m.6772 type:complete len:185 (-) Transcript_3328:32-586(-)
MPSSSKHSEVKKDVYDSNMGRRIVQKENAILSLQNQILEKRRAMIKLKKEQETRRNRHFAKTRLTNWKKMYNIVKMPDESLRPPDKTFNVRVYSNMDRDMWDGGARGEKLRGWFQKNAAQRKMELWNAQDSGYVVKNTAYQPKSDVMQVDHYKSRILNRSPYTVPAHPAGQYFSLPGNGDDSIF